MPHHDVLHAADDAAGDLYGLVELPGVDTDALRRLAIRLQYDEAGTPESLRRHSARIQLALRDALGDPDAPQQWVNGRRANAPALFLFIADETAHAGLTPAEFCELATFLLDEAE